MWFKLHFDVCASCLHILGGDKMRRDIDLLSIFHVFGQEMNTLNSVCLLSSSWFLFVLLWFLFVKHLMMLLLCIIIAVRQS